MEDLIYSDKVASSYRTQFTDKVRSIAAYLEIDPNWLMQVMKSESGLNPKARNIQSGRTVAVGLIQFMSPTAGGLGTNLDAIYNMDALSQLDLVKRYYSPFRGRMKSYFDVYLVTFFPAAIGKPDDWVIHSDTLSASLIAKQNPGININKDNQITIGEFKDYLQSTVPDILKPVVFGLKKIIKKNPVAAAIIGIAFIGAGIYIFTKRKRLNK